MIRKRTTLGPILALSLLLVLLMLFQPLNTRAFQANPHPVSSYEAALEGVQAIQAKEAANDALNPLCHTQLMGHGQPSERVIVFLHGFTNCPQQFTELGKQFHQLGYTVLIPRIPGHGLQDRQAPQLATVTAEELITFTDETINLAQGLGKEVVVVGISAGGVLAGWAAQQRADVTQAVLIAPVFGHPALPSNVMRPATALVNRFPNLYIWWDARLKAELPGPAYAYPGFASRALGKFLHLGLVVQAMARETAAQTPSILVITNPKDPAVNNTITQGLVDLWRAQGTTRVVSYEFLPNPQLLHDLVDPNQIGQQVDYVYPILIEQIHSQP